MKMLDKKTRGDFVKLLIFIVVTTLATSVLVVLIGNLNFEKSNTYKAIFSDATGVVKGDDIRVAGVKVGSVKNVKIVHRDEAEVTFTVRRATALTESSKATIRYRNLVGQRYIALDQGTGDPNAFLPVGGQIPLARTRPALNLTDLFNGFKPLFAALSPDDVNQLSYEIIQVFQGEGSTVRDLLANTAALTTTIADKDQVIGQVIDNLNTVLNTVNADTNQLSGLIVTLQQLVTGLAQDRQPISDAIGALGNLANTTAGLLDQGRAPLKSDIAGLGALSKNLDDNQATVQHFIQYLPQKLTSLIPTASYGSWFNFYLCSAGGQLTPAGGASPFVIPVEPVTQARCAG